MKLGDRITGALATAGLVLVLLSLTGFAVRSAITTGRASETVRQTFTLASFYEQAKDSVDLQESLERKYRLEPGPDVRAKFDAASGQLAVALASVRLHGTQADRELARGVVARRQGYLQAITLLFAAVDAHNTPLALRIDNTRVDPSFDSMALTIKDAADRHRRDAYGSLAALERTKRAVVYGTPIGFALALILIGLFAAVLVRHRRRAERSLQKLEATSSSLLESLPLATYTRPHNRALAAEYLSPQFEALLGFPLESWLADPLFLVNRVHPDDRERVAAALATRAPGTSLRLEYKMVARDGRTVWVQHESRPDDDQIRGYLLDITARKEAEHALNDREEQLRQAQKLEAVGRLASGVAHDFNNLLTAITGYCGFLEESVAGNERQERYVGEISRAAERAAGLTSQLLLFSRKKVLSPTVLGVSDVVHDLESMLRRLLAENITFAVVCEPGPVSVEVDRSQLEQVILNLVVNAQDAMPAGGRLTVETSTVEVADGNFGEAKRHVRLLVSDTGMGMDAETISRAFEPFFTTKDQGKGTGLGLATVYGIVEESGGFVTIESEPGEGASFSVYLPLSTKQPVEAAVEVEVVPSARGSETILLVEDEPVVRALAREILEREGYAVLEAGDGFEALAITDSHIGPIDMVLTDVVMPRLGGRALADRLAISRPGLKVLFTSGYTDDAVVQHGVDHTRDFLQKPYRTEVLAARVREMLDSAPQDDAEPGAAQVPAAA